MLTLLPKGVQTTLLKFFCLKVFSICHRCRWRRWQTLSCEYLREFSKKFEAALIINQRLGGNWFKKKTRSKKFRDTVPLKNRVSGNKWHPNQLWKLYKAGCIADPFIRREMQLSQRQDVLLRSRECQEERQKKVSRAHSFSRALQDMCSKCMFSKQKVWQDMLFWKGTKRIRIYCYMFKVRHLAMWFWVKTRDFAE